MTPERWDQIGDLYDRALDRPAEERMAFLEAACPDDLSLRAEVARMLATDTRPEFLNAPAWIEMPGLVADSAAQRSDAAATTGQIGPYAILRPIGRGGMGEVFLARRDVGAAQQTVALKLLRLGGGEELLLRRFAAEQRILAQFQHPRIARMLDAGQAADGRPYLVMEYVDGEPITDYCDHHRLSVDARLRLFQQVCEGVQVAHQNLVVHRDLKPSNVLVGDAPTGDTAAGQVKLLDFGIAKVLDPLAQEGEPQTQTGRLLTPAYASPEQLAGGAIATTSDIYSLGVLLYELLAGRRPTAKGGTTPTEVARRLADTTATDRPSDAVTTGEAAAETADVRRTSPDRLQRRLRGDLDTIVLKALRTDPARRYVSAAAFAEDVQRHLDGLPVLARPDTLRYRVGKFVRRQWASVAVATAFVVLLAAFAGAMAWQQAQTASERDRAERERVRAEAALVQSETTTGFLMALFQGSDPNVSRGDTLTAFDLLRRGTDRLATLDTEPAVASRLRLLLGRVYRHLGDLDAAAPLLEASLAERRARLGAHEDVAESLIKLANLRVDESRFEEADSLAREAFEMLQALVGPDDPALIPHLGMLARLRQHSGDYAGAAERFREVIALARSVEDPSLSLLLHNYGTLLDNQTDYEGAAAAFEESLALAQEKNGADHPSTLSTQSRLGGILTRLGQHEKATRLLRETVEVRRRVLGPDHPGVATSISSLGIALSAASEQEQALEQYAEAERIYRQTHGDRSANVSSVIYNRARVLNDLGRSTEAEAAYREALSIRREVYGSDHARTALVGMFLGRMLKEQGEYAEAEAVLAEALVTVRDQMGPEHRWTRDTEQWLAEARAGRVGS